MKGNIFLLIALASFFLTGCADFDEGPGFSLRTKRARLQNTWIIEKAYINDTLISGSPVDSFYIEFEKKGNVDLVEVVNTGGVITYITTKGGWDFIDVKDDPKLAILLHSSDNPFNKDILIWELLRLSNDELWITYNNDLGDAIEIDFMPK